MFLVCQVTMKALIISSTKENHVKVVNILRRGSGINF